MCHEVRKETDDMSKLPWNCHVWSTYAYDKRLYKRKEFQEISKAISVYVRSYLDRRKWKRQDKIIMTELWVNYQDKYQFQEYHDHKERVLSGIFYLEVPENAPGLIIQNPQKANFDDLFFFQEEVRDVNEINVETGDLIMFPSWLDHGVNANMTDKPRINIAFNFGIPKIVDAFS